MKVTVSKRGDYWLVDWNPGEKRHRRFFHSKADAEAVAESLRLADDRQKHSWKSLTAAERYDLVSVQQEIKQSGLTLRTVWERFKNLPAVGVGPPLDDAITELIESKENAGRSPKYLTGLETVLNQFAKGREQLAIGKIGLPEVEEFLDSKKIASRQTLRARLSTLFKFAIRRGYRADNPCERLEVFSYPHKPPAVFTPQQVRDAIKWLRSNRPAALPWFILTTFCGLRPEEAEKTSRSDIHLKEGWIRIEAQTSKVRQRRVLYPKKEALALLGRSLKRGRLPLDTQAKRRAIRSLRSVLGFATWPKDITRHSAASYWLADCSSTAKVAEALGHSESVLRRHYKALVTRKQAKEFWRIT